MGRVVQFNGERLTLGKGNADLVEHLLAMADAVEEGVFGECQLVSVITLDGEGVVRHANRATRHFMQTEYIGILELAKHQVLNDIHPEWPEADEIA